MDEKQTGQSTTEVSTQSSILSPSRSPSLVIDRTDRMAKPEDDFQGYMENIQKRELDAQKFDAMMEKHEEWRQNTWGGYAVRQMQAMGHHFRPFFDALGDIMRADKNSPSNVMLVVFLRSLVIMAYVLFAYALIRILKHVVGREIVFEEEIIIEVDDDDDQAQTPRRSARDKKKGQ